jgi:hypothetical protein
MEIKMKTDRSIRRIVSNSSTPKGHFSLLVESINRTQRGWS